jgi:hypothetical protein
MKNKTKLLNEYYSFQKNKLKNAKNPHFYVAPNPTPQCNDPW